MASVAAKKKARHAKAAPKLVIAPHGSQDAKQLGPRTSTFPPLRANTQDVGSDFLSLEQLWSAWRSRRNAA